MWEMTCTAWMIALYLPDGTLPNSRCPIILVWPTQALYILSSVEEFPKVSFYLARLVKTNITWVQIPLVLLLKEVRQRGTERRASRSEQKLITTVVWQSAICAFSVMIPVFVYLFCSFFPLLLLCKAAVCVSCSFSFLSSSLSLLVSFFMVVVGCIQPPGVVCRVFRFYPGSYPLIFSGCAASLTWLFCDVYVPILMIFVAFSTRYRFLDYDFVTPLCGILALLLL